VGDGSDGTVGPGRRQKPIVYPTGQQSRNQIAGDKITSGTKKSNSIERGKSMKKSILTILLAAAIAFGQADNARQSRKGPASEAKVLTRAEIDDLLAKPDQVLIIDVRRPDEVKDIGGFPVYLSVQINDLEKSLAWIPKGRTIITLSNHAARGGRAADILTRAGFQVAGAAGAEDYEAQGGKLRRIAPPPPNPKAKKE
jgi:rhodanese-related sulfurtransferase